MNSGILGTYFFIFLGTVRIHLVTI